MLDGVAAGDDGVLLPVAAEDVASRLFTEAMRLVDHAPGGRAADTSDVLRLSRGAEGVRAGRKQLDPVRAVLDLLAYRGSAFVSGAMTAAGQRVRQRRRIGGLAPQTIPRVDTW